MARITSLKGAAWLFVATWCVHTADHARRLERERDQARADNEENVWTHTKALELVAKARDEARAERDESRRMLQKRNDENRELRKAVRKFVAEFEDTRWGNDGDCGLGRHVAALEYEATKNDEGH